MRDWKVVIVGLAALVVLFGCNFGSGDSSSSSSNTAGTASSSSAGTASSSSTPVQASGTVKVTLSWDKPIDMDLEIWDSPGQNLKLRSFNQCGSDIQDGTQGSEYFEFKQYGSDNYANGKYVVSVYFAGMGDASIEECFADLEIIKADGSRDTRRRKIFWEAGQDQWHAFRIDAATGNIEDIDEFITITTTE